MRYLVTGATGMLGKELMRAIRARGLFVTGAARSGADIALELHDAAAIADAVATVQPDVIVNAAAMTDHDACEHDVAGAYAVNARAVAFLAEAARRHGCKLVQISTDQFYTGDRDLPHAEDHPVTFLPSEYARTKFAAEGFAATAPNALVLRTNITGLRGDVARPTFIEWVFETAEAGRPFKLFNDYFTSTIDTGAFAEALLDLVAKNAEGLLNVACGDVSSKQTFILAAVEALTGTRPAYETVSVEDLPTARAESAGLDVGKAERLLGRRLPGTAAVARNLAEAWRRRA